MPTPFRADEDAIVFTGAMDYWPNVDAVSWFAKEMLPAIVARATARPLLHRRRPAHAGGSGARAEIPGSWSRDAFPMCGPTCRHARVVVAPLRVARGIQNKVLEAMAMARPVVVSAAAAGALSGVAATDFDVADGAPEFIRKTIALMDGERGASHRQGGAGTRPCRLRLDEEPDPFRRAAARPERSTGGSCARHGAGNDGVANAG